MQAATAQEAYRTAMIATAGRARLVVMLYQGLLRFTRQAILALERRDYEAAHTSFIRAQDIILELASSLDLERGGEISRNLLPLYLYGYHQLVRANCQKSATPAEDVLRLFGELVEVWTAIAAYADEREASNPVPPAPAGVR